MGKIKLELWKQVVLALILGVIAGYFLGEKAQIFKPLGIIFINLIKMVIVPLVFFSLIAGINSVGGTGSASRIAFKSIIIYLLMSILAVAIGFAVALVLKPGASSNFKFLGNVTTLPENIPQISEVLLNLIPTNAIASMAEGNILQIILFSFFVGFVMNSMDDKTLHLRLLCNEAADLSFKMIEIIVKLSPFGVFGYISWSIGTQGFDIILSLVKLIVAITIACVVQYIFFGIIIWVFGKLNPKHFFIKMLEPQLLAFSTSSSKATLSTTMRVLHEKMGVSKASTNFVLPIGSSINMDGGAIYLSISCLFFAQGMGMELEMHHYLTLLFICTIGSMGAAGIPSGIMLFLGMALNSVGLPLEAIALVAGVDRILDMITTSVNVTGDACVTLLIDKSEKHLDEELYNS